MGYRQACLITVSMLLVACASRSGSGVPTHYAWDSLRARCLQNPIYCATATEKDIGGGPVQTVGASVASVAAVLRVLDDATKLSIQEALEQCADLARSEVLLRHNGAFAGPVPNAGECKKLTVDSTGRSVTWAVRLGLEMHEVALQCAETRLRELRPGGFSLKPRYRYDRRTGQKSLVSAEEKDALLRQGGEALKGTLEPDVVIHSGDPLQVQAVYDFKFRCVNTDETPSWRKYPQGHRYAGKSQGDMYQEALGPTPQVVTPRVGVF